VIFFVAALLDRSSAETSTQGHALADYADFAGCNDRVPEIIPQDSTTRQ
jgi:hypothetical protein